MCPRRSMDNMAILLDPVLPVCVEDIKNKAKEHNEYNDSLWVELKTSCKGGGV